MNKSKLKKLIVTWGILITLGGGAALATGSTIQAKIRAIFASYRQKIKEEVRSEILEKEPNTDSIEKKIEETKNAIQKETDAQVNKAKNDLSDLEKSKLQEVTSELDKQKSVTVDEISNTVTQVKKEYENTLDNRIEELMKKNFQTD